MIKLTLYLLHLFGTEKAAQIVLFRRRRFSVIAIYICFQSTKHANSIYVVPLSPETKRRSHSLISIFDRIVA